MKTKRIRRILIDSMAEGIANITDERFDRIARAVAYLSRRMERGGA